MSSEAKARARRDAYRRKAEALRNYKAARGCADCGEKDPIVLELDHRDPEQKNERLRIRKGPTIGWLSWADLAAELEKCDVVCANCHRRRTHVQQGQGRVAERTVRAVARSF